MYDSGAEFHHVNTLKVTARYAIVPLDFLSHPVNHLSSEQKLNGSGLLP